MARGTVGAGGSNTLAGASKRVSLAGLATALLGADPGYFDPASSPSSNDCHELEAGKLANELDGETPVLAGRDGGLSALDGGGEREAARADAGLSARSQKEPVGGGVCEATGEAKDRWPPGCLSSSFTRPTTGLETCGRSRHRMFETDQVSS